MTAAIKVIHFPKYTEHCEELHIYINSMSCFFLLFLLSIDNLILFSLVLQSIFVILPHSRRRRLLKLYCDACQQIKHKKAHHNHFFKSTQLFCSQHIRVCCVLVRKNDRGWWQSCRSCRCSNIVNRICCMHWLQLRSRWLWHRALWCRLGNLQSNDFATRRFEMIAQRHLHHVDAHRCQCKSENEIKYWGHHVEWTWGNEITKSWGVNWMFHLGSQ